MPGVDTCSIQVAGLRPSVSLGTLGIPCRSPVHMNDLLTTRPGHTLSFGETVPPKVCMGLLVQYR